MKRHEIEADIAKRNTGTPTLTVWDDGSWLVHGFRDAEIAYLCEPDKVIMSLSMDTWEPVTFITPQQRINLAEKLFGSRRGNPPEVVQDAG